MFLLTKHQCIIICLDRQMLSLAYVASRHRQASTTLSKPSKTGFYYVDLALSENISCPFCDYSLRRCFSVISFSNFVACCPKDILDLIISMPIMGNPNLNPNHYKIEQIHLRGALNMCTGGVH
jgi:hypothetical protein